MEKSTEIFVDAKGLNFVSGGCLQSYLFGVHQTYGWPESDWSWHETRGPQGSPDKSWFDTEDGKDFDRTVNDFLDNTPFGWDEPPGFWDEPDPDEPIN